MVAEESRSQPTMAPRPARRCFRLYRNPTVLDRLRQRLEYVLKGAEAAAGYGHERGIESLTAAAAASLSVASPPNRDQIREKWRRPRLPPPEIADEDVLRDDAIGRDLVGVDGGRRHFRCLDLTVGIADLDVLCLMDLAEDLIGLDTVRIDSVGANLRGLDLVRVEYLGRCRGNRRGRRRYDHGGRRRRRRRWHDHCGRWRLRLWRHFNADVVGPHPPDRERERDEPSDCGCYRCTTFRHHVCS